MGLFSKKTHGFNIIIVGCGKVGISLVESLSKENHDITVIDVNHEIVQKVAETYDVLGITGNGSSYSVQIEAGIRDADIISYLHPRSVKKIKMEGKIVEHETIRATNVYLVTFILTFVVSLFLLSFENHDMITNFTSVAATINNIGPGLNMTGPVRNFGFFSNFSKYVLMFDMLAGRLELFPILLLFCPSVWKPKKSKKTEI